MPCVNGQQVAGNLLRCMKAFDL